MSNYIMDLRKVVGHAPLLQAGASIIVENENGQVLLEKRTDNHQWGYAGGSIELGERKAVCYAGGNPARGDHLARIGKHGAGWVGGRISQAKSQPSQSTRHANQLCTLCRRLHRNWQFEGTAGRTSETTD